MNSNPMEPSKTAGSSVGGESRHGPPNKMTGGFNSEGFKSINCCVLSSLPVIGDKLSRKKDNMVRFYFENFNGIRNQAKGVDKGKYFSGLINKM